MDFILGFDRVGAENVLFGGRKENSLALIVEDGIVPDRDGAETGVDGDARARVGQTAVAICPGLASSAPQAEVYSDQ